MVPSPLIDVVSSAMAAKIVYAAAELRVANLLAAGPQTGAELAEQTQTHGPSLRRLLQALAALGVVTQTGPDRFELTEIGAQLRVDASDSVRALVLTRCGPEFWRSWDELVVSVRTGEAGWDPANRMPPAGPTRLRSASSRCCSPTPCSRSRWTRSGSSPRSASQGSRESASWCHSS
jgi:Dimerisation domain